ncbi:hypothetical protein, partial [Campylobacter jejuni]|uniref:hypothetical protein n=1 Tax=Campylobacter jejuni TaxID=197 RepID=UPI002FE1CD20
LIFILLLGVLFFSAFRTKTPGKYYEFFNHQTVLIPFNPQHQDFNTGTIYEHFVYYCNRLCRTFFLLTLKH